MTLARKLTIQLTALVVAVALIAAAALWGLVRFEQQINTAENYHEQLRLVYEAGHHAASARTLLRLDADEALVEDEYTHMVRRLNDLAKLVETDHPARSRQVQGTISNWNFARIGLDGPTRDSALTNVVRDVANLAGQINGDILLNRANASAQLKTTITLIGILAALLFAGAVSVGVNQMRSIMRPLRAFDRGMQEVAEANFKKRIKMSRETEFQQLADRFNQMAERLDTHYQTLEDEVNTKSRALVRSERLAGVGYLAAGLAHEINNPLGIIGGYAEAALAKPDDRERASKALRVIADEAFRCKEITGKLLSLARPTDAEPTDVDLAHVLAHAADLMRGLESFSGHTVDTDLAAGLVVTGHASELTQVAINLLANALEATPSGGRVSISAERRGPWAHVAVVDSGRGMNAEQLERVFEPFYTDAPERDTPGTGLGLAVTHAIVTQHGGRITATSGGEGTGATFTVELPLAKESGDSSHA